MASVVVAVPADDGAACVCGDDECFFALVGYDADALCVICLCGEVFCEAVGL